MSDPQEEDVTGGEQEEVIAMEEDSPELETEATSIWDVARQNSSKMVLASVVDDMEDRAAKQKDELLQLRRRAEDAEAALSSTRQTAKTLEASALQDAETKKELEKKFREASQETQVLKESISNEKERADRVGVESDRLREEIRYAFTVTYKTRKGNSRFSFFRFAANLTL